MKATITIACILVVGVVAFWCLAHHYEFRTGMDGRVIWRFNNFTGKCEYVQLGDGAWTAISDQQPPTFTPADFEPQTNNRTFTAADFEPQTNKQTQK